MTATGVEIDSHESIRELCEVSRRIKELEDKKRDLSALLLAKFTEEGTERWENAHFLAYVVEQQGREVADLAQLERVGMRVAPFVNRGDPVRFLVARRK